MNNNLQQLKELALRYSKEFKNMSDDDLKARFIESFGIDKWNEEEMLAKLIPFGDGVANYLGIDPVPIVFEELGKEDSRIYIKEQYIAINEALKENEGDITNPIASATGMNNNYSIKPIFAKEANPVSLPLFVQKTETIGLFGANIPFILVNHQKELFSSFNII